MITLFGFSTTRFEPIAAAISFFKGTSESNAIFARSSPLASDTRLPKPTGGTGTGPAAAATGIFATANAAAPPINDVFRKFRRDLCHPVVFVIPAPSIFPASIRLRRRARTDSTPSDVTQITENLWPLSKNHTQDVRRIDTKQ